jgi:hypothetical protein
MKGQKKKNETFLQVFNLLDPSSSSVLTHYASRTQKKIESVYLLHLLIFLQEKKKKRRLIIITAP